MPLAPNARVAVVGGGAAGLLCAWGLAQQHRVTLYEARDRLGGSVRTLPLTFNGREYAIETGFGSFAPKAFPRFGQLLRDLGVPTGRRRASITIERPPARAFRWPPGPHSLLTLLREPSHLALYRNFLRVMETGKQLEAREDFTTTMADVVEQAELPAAFVHEVLYAFLGTSRAIAPEEVPGMSAYPFLRFLGMPGDEPGGAWTVIEGGAGRYVDRLVERIHATSADLRLGDPVRALQPEEGAVRLRSERGDDLFDAVVVATESHVAARLLATHPEAAARGEALSRLHQTSFVHLVHSDTRWMPSDRAAWSSANVVKRGDVWAFTNWLAKGATPLFSGWTTDDTTSVRLVHDAVTWTHVRMTPSVVDARAALAQDSGAGQIWVAGTYTTGIDSHEGTVRSATSVLHDLVDLDVVPGPLRQGS